MKINKPKIKYQEEKSFKECIINDDFSNKIISLVEDNVCILNKTFDCCEFNHLDFSKIFLEDVELIDCIFNDCDLSNTCFDNQYITRFVFHNCKLSGISFINANLKDIFLDNCQLKYANFTETSMHNIIINDSDLSESFFQNVEAKNWSLNKNTFYHTEIIGTNLKDVDFTTCNINGIIFDKKSVKGIIINTFQCRDIVGMLEIKVKD